MGQQILSTACNTLQGVSVYSLPYLTIIIFLCLLLIPELKLQRVNLLLNHLTEVITGKDHLLGRLQSRATENSLKIEAPFQKWVAMVHSSLKSRLSILDFVSQLWRKLEFLQKLSDKIQNRRPGFITLQQLNFLLCTYIILPGDKLIHM